MTVETYIVITITIPLTTWSLDTVLSVPMSLNDLANILVIRQQYHVTECVTNVL